VRPDEVVVNLHPRQDWGVGLLETPHDLLPVSPLAVLPLHLVVVDLAPEPDVRDVSCASLGVDGIPLLRAGSGEVVRPVADENLGQGLT
jgi:hypothetical protein